MKCRNKGISLLDVIIGIILLIIITGWLVFVIKNYKPKNTIKKATITINNETKTIYLESYYESRFSGTMYLNDIDGNTYVTSDYTIWEEEI